MRRFQELVLKNPLHRKKLQLAIKTILSKQPEKSAELDYIWVTRVYKKSKECNRKSPAELVRWENVLTRRLARWHRTSSVQRPVQRGQSGWTDAAVPDCGECSRGCGAVTNRVMFLFNILFSFRCQNDLLYLKVTSQLHHLSIKCAIHVLHVNKFQPNCLRRRPGNEVCVCVGETLSNYLILWLSHYFSFMIYDFVWIYTAFLALGTSWHTFDLLTEKLAADLCKMFGAIALFWISRCTPVFPEQHKQLLCVFELVKICFLLRKEMRLSSW